VPAEHEEQVSLVVAPVTVENLPAWQSWHAWEELAAREGEKVPAEQG